MNLRLGIFKSAKLLIIAGVFFGVSLIAIYGVFTLNKSGDIKKMKTELFALKDNEIPFFFENLLAGTHAEELEEIFGKDFGVFRYMDDSTIRVYVDNSDITHVPIMTTLLIDLIYRNGLFVEARFFKKGYT